MNPELLVRLKHTEDNFTERKRDGTPGRDLRKAVVAFANSVPEGRTAVLFVGVADDGTPLGVKDADSLQKTIRQICKVDCYPPIEFTSETEILDGKVVVAVEIPFSSNRPHFSGPAFVREGSQSVPATREKFEELINSRVDVCRAIQREGKEAEWRVLAVGKAIGAQAPNSNRSHTESCNARILECNSHYVRFLRLSDNSVFNEQTKMMSIQYDEVNHKPLLVVRWQG